MEASMTALILSLMFAISSPASYGNNAPRIRAKDYSCAEIHSILRSHGRAVLQFGIFSSSFYPSPASCSKFEIPEWRYFKAKNREQCRAISCAYDKSRNR
jgi:hypothetical protein